MMRFVSVRILFSVFLLLSVAFLTGCDYQENATKITGEWVSEEFRAKHRTLPPGTMRFLFEPNGRVIWRAGMSQREGKFSFRGSMLHIMLDRPMPGGAGTLFIAEVTFQGTDRFTMEGQGGNPQEQSRGDFTRVPDRAQPEPPPPIDDKTDLPPPEPPSPSTGPPDAPPEIGANIPEPTKPRRTSAPDNSKNIQPAYSADELGTLPATAAQPIVLDLSMRKPCVVPKDLKSTLLIEKHSIREMDMGMEPWNVRIQPVKRKPYTNPPEPITLDTRGSGLGGVLLTSPSMILCSDPDTGIALVSWNIMNQPDTWVNIVSLSKSKAVARKLGFKCKFYDISPNGKYVAATTSLGDPSVSGNALLVLRIDDASCRPMLMMTPFDDAPDNQKQGKSVNIKQIRWLDNGRLILASEQKVIVCLDVSNQTLQYGVSGSTFSGLLGIHSTFELTPDRKYMITELNGTPGVVLDATTGAHVGTFRAEEPAQKIAANEIRFSPDGRYFTSGDGWIWDCTTGRVSGKADTFGGFNAGTSSGWISDQYIFAGNKLVHPMGNDTLVDYSLNVPSISTVIGDRLAYVAANKYYPFKPIPMLVIGNPVPPSEHLAGGEPIQGWFTVTGIEFD